MSQSDQTFFDSFSLVIGIQVGIAFGIFLVANTMAEEQTASLQQDPVYQDLIVARLEPVGKATAEGEARIVKAGVPSAAPATSAEQMSGPEVYAAACAMCHGEGTAGAPRVGDVAVWQPRIAQGEEVLTRNVLQGFSGETGYMPAKGGRVDLSDEEILAAMVHMLEESS